MSDTQNEIEDLKKRVDKLESQIANLFKNLGIPTMEAPRVDASQRVIELLKTGDTIGAIKAFREETGASLKDAKEFVDSIVL